jgi:hypothetical protein
MKVLPGGNTYYNRWPVPVELHQPQCTVKVAEQIFAADAGVQRSEETDLGEVEPAGPEDAGSADSLVPFPHERHMALTQEWIHTFNAEILVIGAPAAGASLMGGLISNVRAVAVARNAAHRNFLMTRLEDFVKQRRLVPGYVPRVTPTALITYAAKHPEVLQSTAPAPAPPPKASPPPPPAPRPPAPPPNPTAPAPSPPAPPASPAGGALAAFGAAVLS